MPCGIYVVGTRAGTLRNLMTISWVTQVATDPKLVGIGVESQSVTHGLLTAGGVFALSILPRAERALVRRFAKPVTESTLDDVTGSGAMQGQPVHSASTGAPLLDVASAWLDCRVRHVLALGSHSWFVGEVVDCGEGAVGTVEGSGDTPVDGVLRMEDTRMNYGG